MCRTSSSDSTVRRSLDLGRAVARGWGWPSRRRWWRRWAGGSELRARVLARERPSRSPCPYLITNLDRILILGRTWLEVGYLLYLMQDGIESQKEMNEDDGPDDEHARGDGRPDGGMGRWFLVAVHSRPPPALGSIFVPAGLVRGAHVLQRTR